MRRAARAAACASVILTVGCAPWRSPALRSASEPDPGLVYVFPGMEGNPAFFHNMHRGFRDAGVRAEVRLFDWHRPFNSMANLVEFEQNREKARDVAAELAEWRAAHPHANLDFAAYSAGTAMAVLTAQESTASLRIRNIILIQSALSRDYDLCPTLQHVDGYLLHYYSPYDGVVLGWGTTTFGTSDRKFAPAAGKLAFRVENSVADASLRAKFRQIAWSPAWREAGHLGNHVSMIGYEWNKRFVAPHLLPECKEVALNTH